MVDFFQKSEDLKATENLLWTIFVIGLPWVYKFSYVQILFHTIHLGHLVFHIALPGISSYSLKSRDLGISRCKMSKHISGFVEEHWFTLYIYSNIASNPGCSKTKDNCFTSGKFNIEFMIQQKLTRTTRTLKSLGSVGGVCNSQSVNYFQVELQQQHLWHGTFHPGWLRFQDLIISCHMT